MTAHNRRIISYGDRFNRLMILRESEPYPSGGRRFVCVCECGNTKIVGLNAMVSGLTKSCGCLHRQIGRDHFLHGFKRKERQHPLYLVWRGIKTRCLNSRSQAYKNYGGKGILIYPEWRNDPVKFVQWCLDNGWTPDLTIDRINSNGHYEPGNCEFVSKPENSRRSNEQRRRTKKNDFILGILSLST